jgi:drug/metabolite transporter (DMT)-like permease
MSDIEEATTLRVERKEDKSKNYLLFLTAGMLFTGTCNTLLNKVQDLQCVENCDDPDPTKHQHFEQPVYQTLNMFIGEILCLLFVYLSTGFQTWQVWYYTIPSTHRSTRRLSHSSCHGGGGGGGHTVSTHPSQYGTDDGFPADIEEIARDKVEALQDERKQMRPIHRLLFWMPALCDIMGTTLMNVGLIYTTASVYQMLRGAVVIFSAIVSIMMLRYRIKLFQWFALFTVVTGVALVGLSSLQGKTVQVTEPNPIKVYQETDDFIAAMIGIMMVLTAQVFTAIQFVLEEKIMTSYRVEPLMAVGLEGLFGCLTILLAMPLLYVCFGLSHPGGFFDFPYGWQQIWSHQGIWIASIAIALSIAFFNWFGLSVTRSMSSVARATIDTCRTLFIWMVSLGLGWETFKWLQVLGFAVLVYGTFLYNGVVRPPRWLVHRDEETVVVDETEPILGRE